MIIYETFVSFPTSKNCLVGWNIFQSFHTASSPHLTLTVEFSLLWKYKFYGIPRQIRQQIPVICWWIWIRPLVLRYEVEFRVKVFIKILTKGNSGMDSQPFYYKTILSELTRQSLSLSNKPPMKVYCSALSGNLIYSKCRSYPKSWIPCQAYKYQSPIFPALSNWKLTCIGKMKLIDNWSI